MPLTISFQSLLFWARRFIIRVNGMSAVSHFPYFLLSCISTPGISWPSSTSLSLCNCRMPWSMSPYISWCGTSPTAHWSVQLKALDISLSVEYTEGIAHFGRFPISLEVACGHCLKIVDNWHGEADEFPLYPAHYVVFIIIYPHLSDIVDMVIVDSPLENSLVWTQHHTGLLCRSLNPWLSILGLEMFGG